MAFDDLKNKLREKAQLFDEGGVNALKYGKPGIRPYKVRRSVVDAALQLQRQRPNANLAQIIDAHIVELGKASYHREAMKFWTEVKRLWRASTTPLRGGEQFDFIIEDDAGKGWPPFEKPALLQQRTITAEYSGRELPPASTDIIKKD